MNVPRIYWGEAVRSAAYLVNRMPSSALGFQTPLNILRTYLEVPHVPNLEPQIFGCTAYVHVPQALRSKLDPRARKCIFVGYSDVQKGYRCYDPIHQKIYTSLDVSFVETLPFFPPSSLQGERSNSEEKLPVGPTVEHEVEADLGRLDELTEHYQILYDEPDDNEMPTPILIASDPWDIPTSTQVIPNSQLELNDLNDANLQIPAEVVQNDSNEVDGVENISQRTSSRSTKGISRRTYEPDIKARGKYPMCNYLRPGRDTGSQVFSAVANIMIPNNVEEALQFPEWVGAMNEELEALKKNGTWDLVSLPKGKKLVGCKWVFTVKLKADGSLDRYKARLVARGYTQRYGVDYDETFAPVAKMNTVRILISLAANQGWELSQLDVKNAFLNGELEEEVYMQIPPGMMDSTSDKVCRLRKSLYGLKQSPRAWFGKLTATMKKLKYKQSNSDHTLFIRRREGKVTMLLVYVDDMIITGNDKEEIQSLKEKLKENFEMKDLRKLTYFLGIEVQHTKQGIFLSQKKYVLDLLAETGMLDCKPVDTPMEMNHILELLPDQISTDKDMYQRLVGKLIYLAHTRAEIAYAVSVVSQFMQDPSKEHMEAVTRILRYLKTTPSMGLLFSENGNLNVKGYTDNGEKMDEDEDVEVEGYTNSDWAGDQTSRRSTSGYFVFVGGNLVSWRSKKQNVVSRSSAEAEF